MKPVLAWIKSNLLIVIFTALIVVMLPTAWVVSGMWNDKIRKQQTDTAKKALDALSAIRVNYTVNQYDPVAQPFAHNAVPNQDLIRFFKTTRDSLSQQAAAIVAKAEHFNKGVGPEAQAVGRGEHKPMVEGVFPKGVQSDLDRMEDALLGRRGLPNPYDLLLKSVRAGGPTDAARLGETLEDLLVRKKEQITGATKRELTPDEAAKVAKELADQRMSEYANHASTISVYATTASLPNNLLGSFIPVGDHIDAAFLNLSDLYIFQWDYWILEDVMAAVRLANSPDGRLENVDRAVVKRIDSIFISLPSGVYRSKDGLDVGGRSAGGADPSGQFGQPPAPPVGGPAAMASLDFSQSITGRRAANGVYDTRNVTLTVVVSSSRLQDLIQAIERTNFMTVADMDLAEVKVWDELGRGYYFGPEHVVKATLQIETVWLRSWTSAYLPGPLKASLKFPDVPTDGSAPVAPPPPPPRAPG